MMKKLAYLAAIIFLLAFAPVRSIAQEVRIESIFPYNTVVSGQIVRLVATGVGERSLYEQVSQDGFKVQITQDGATHEAKIGSVGSSMWSIGSPPAMNLCRSIDFIIPRGLHEGDAQLTLIHQKRRSSPLALQILSRPARPQVLHVMKIVDITGPSSGDLPGLKQGNSPLIRFETGRESALGVQPLIDPDQEDAAILVTFKQGGQSREVQAKVVYYRANEQAMISPPRYEARVRAPEGFTPGEAELEVRIRANGQLSEPEKLTVLLVTPKLAAGYTEGVAPRLVNISPSKVGVGQSVMISVESRKSLGPNLTKTLIVLEQNGRRYRIKPELNSATNLPAALAEAGVLLIGRIGGEVTGKVEVKVLNPSHGEEAGLSEGLPLEILDEVLPPENVSVHQSSDIELGPLRQIHEVMQRTRGTSPYEPGARYLTIQAAGLDYNPDYVRIEIEQNGRVVRLKKEDFSLSIPRMMIVRLPDSIKSGQTQVSISNQVKDRVSEPVKRTLEISER
ncbi:MAG: hypothetical protein AB1631_26410 [Acidobacteriota bacterium]